MSHQLSLDISLFLLHFPVFLFPSFHWVMSWSNTNEVRESSLSCSQYTWSSSGRRHINSTHSVIAINCNICSRCWWSTFNVGQKNRENSSSSAIVRIQHKDWCWHYYHCLKGACPHSNERTIIFSTTHRFSEYPKCAASKYLACRQPSYQGKDIARK